MLCPKFSCSVPSRSTIILGTLEVQGCQSPKFDWHIQSAQRSWKHLQSLCPQTRETACSGSLSMRQSTRVGLLCPQLSGKVGQNQTIRVSQQSDALLLARSNLYFEDPARFSSFLNSHSANKSSRVPYNFWFASKSPIGKLC